MIFPMLTATEAETIEYLKACSEVYYNSDIVFLSDAEFDELYHYAEQKWPNNEFFKQIGAAVRGSEIVHSSKIGGLEQVHTGELQKWLTRSGYIKEDLVVSEKLDGSSLTIKYNDKLQYGLTRGDGVTGKDVTRHVLMLPSVPKEITLSGEVEVRGEFIIKKVNFETVKEILQKLSGKEYTNLRGIANGLINCKEIHPAVAQYIDFVAYSTNLDNLSKRETFKFLTDQGFLTPGYVRCHHVNLNEITLNVMLNKMRNDSPYEIDGVVVEFNEIQKRTNLGYHESTRNPKFAFKWKTRSADNLAQTTVREVQWNISRSNYWKPRVRFEPVELSGATIEWSSGFNAKFIIENGVGPGAVISITRAGDVIPHIDSVDVSVEASLPPGKWHWNDSEVDAISDDVESADVELLRVLHFFNTLEIDQVQEATILKLFEAPADSISKILKLDRGQWNFLIGKNGEKAYDSLHTKLHNVHLWELIAAWPYFGRGFGKRRAKALVDAYAERVLDLRTNEVIALEGFQEKTADTFFQGIESFKDFYFWLLENKLCTIRKMDDIIVQSQGKFKDLKFVFTGIRSKEAEELIVLQGGEVQSGVKKDTTHLVVKDLKKMSNKMNAAIEAGLTIITIDDLMERLK